MNLIPKFPSFTVLYNLRLPTPITSVMWEIFLFFSLSNATQNSRPLHMHGQQDKHIFRRPRKKLAGGKK